jgi:phage gpG-like protein
MKIEFDSDLNLEKIPDQITDQVYRDLAKVMRVEADHIARRTHKQNKSYTGEELTSQRRYSKSYLEYKRDLGRSGKVDLQDTGDLARSYTSEVVITDTNVVEGRIGIRGAENAKKAVELEARGWKFFGLSKVRRELIFRRIRALITKNLGLN